jgi:hypothetical protein
VHPFLAMTAVVHADWSKRLSFHGGAFVLEGQAWGVLGGREQGKSSTLAWLASHGYPIVCDDAIITDGDIVFAGPRCLDLREGSAHHFGIGNYIGVIGARDRWRVPLGPVAAELPLAGWINLDWGDRTGCERMAVREVFHILAEQRALRIGQQNPLGWLDAASKPAFVFRRPRSWDDLDAAMAALLRALRETRPSRA